MHLNISVAMFMFGYLKIVEQRIKEAVRMGLKTIVIPSASQKVKSLKGVEIIEVRRLQQALEAILE